MRTSREITHLPREEDHWHTVIRREADVSRAHAHE